MNFTWDIDPVLIQLGPLAIRYYGLLFLGVFLGGWALFRWQIRRGYLVHLPKFRQGGATEEEANKRMREAADVDASDIFMPGILGVLIGARLGHVLFYDLDRFLQDPLWLFQIWKGGLASHGATAGLLVSLYIYGRRHKQSYFEVLDRFAYSAALGSALVRLGNFFNSEIVGRVTDQTWGVRFVRYDHVIHKVPLDQVPLRHPSQLYEFGLGMFVMLCIYLVDRLSGKEKRPRGALISTFFLVYFPGRMLIEQFKEFQTLAPDAGITMGQILSVLPAAMGLIAMIIVWVKRVPAGWTPRPLAPAPKKKYKKRRK